MTEFTNNQKRMMNGPFHITRDHNSEHLATAEALVEDGLLRREIRVVDGETRYDYTPVE